MGETFISGGISGAITNIRTKEAELYAIKKYESIRNDSHDIEKIAKNLSMDINRIRLIKNYLFYMKNVNENGEMKRFDPDFYIAQSWNRLAYEPENIQEHDKILIQHESMEIKLVMEGYSQEEAHDITSERYNYAEAASQFYAEVRKKQRRTHKETPLDIDMMQELAELRAKSEGRENEKKDNKQIRNRGGR